MTLLLDAAADPTQAATDGMLPLDCASFLTRDQTAVTKLLRARTLERASLEGGLVKLGSERKTWRRRYCVLLPGQLRYYGDEALTDHRGRMDLSALRAAIPRPRAAAGLAAAAAFGAAAFGAAARGAPAELAGGFGCAAVGGFC